MPPDISVVIPTFRRPRELGEALASALSQAEVSVEAIVVDDDPDMSAERIVLGLADPRVTYVTMHRPSGGRPAMVRNAALPHLTAPLVHFLDDDDIVPPGHYARAVQAFAQNKDVGVVFGRIEPFGANETAVRGERDYFELATKRARACRRFGKKWGFAATMLFDNTLLVCSAAMIRRDCIAALEGFDPNLALVEDVDFFARAIRRFGAVFLDATVLNYRIGPSLMHRRDVQPIIDDCYRLMCERYRREWGRWNYLLFKLFARTLVRTR